MIVFPHWVSVTKRRQNYLVFLLTLPQFLEPFSSPGIWVKGKEWVSYFENMGLVPEGPCAKGQQVALCVTWVKGWRELEDLFFSVRFVFSWNSIKLFLVMHLYSDWTLFLSRLLLWVMFILSLLSLYQKAAWPSCDLSCPNKEPDAPWVK